jgi:hypothetical protein
MPTRGVQIGPPPACPRTANLEFSKRFHVVTDVVDFLVTCWWWDPLVLRLTGGSG